MFPYLRQSLFSLTNLFVNTVLFVSVFVLLLGSNITNPSSKQALNRTQDVYDLQELYDEPDPHATLPFISHHTLNLSRDLIPDSEFVVVVEVSGYNIKFQPKFE